MTDNNLLKAARLIQQARDIKDRYRHGEAMAKQDAEAIDSLIRDAANLRKDAERGQRIDELTDWIAEPQYKHDMTNGTGSAFAASGGYPAAGRSDDRAARETKAFLEFVRSGSIPQEAKASLIEDATGQNLVPVDYAGTILKSMARLGVVRGLAFVHPTRRDRVDIGSVAVGTPTWGRLEVTGGPPADALGATPAAKDQITVHELTALAKIGFDELDDTDNLEAVVREAVADKFSEVEDDAYTGGSGTAQPWALTHNVTQNVNAVVDNTPTPDDLKKLTFQVPARFRNTGRAVFIGHSKVEQAVALMKDNDGRYLFQPSTAAAEPGRLFGYPWHTADGLADPSVAGITQKSVVFGDVYAGYVIAQRTPTLAVQRLTELYAHEGKVGLLFKLRVGGDVVRPTALATYTL